MPLTIAEIDSAMQGFGMVRLPMFTFRQGDSPGEGYCRGACLNWVRRQFGGRTAGFAYEASSEKGQRTARIMREVNTAFFAAGRAAFDEPHTELAQRRTDLAREQSRLAAGASDAAIEAFNLRNAALSKDLRDFNARSDASHVKGRTAAGWDHLSGPLDQALARAKGKPADRIRKKFANIRAVDGIDAVFVANADELERLLCGLFARLSASSCAIISCSRDKATTGHAMVVTRTPKGNLATFDPNCGVYMLQPDTSVADPDRSIARGIVYLMRTALHEDPRTFLYEIFVQEH